MGETHLGCQHFCGVSDFQLTEYSFLQLLELIIVKLKKCLTISRSELADDNDYKGILLYRPVHSRSRSRVSQNWSYNSAETILYTLWIVLLRFSRKSKVTLQFHCKVFFTVNYQIITINHPFKPLKSFYFLCNSTLT